MKYYFKNMPYENIHYLETAYSTVGKRTVGPPAAALNELLAKKTPLWKRAMDAVVSLLGLILLLPLFLCIALYIRIVSPGPILFKQKRVGRGGKLFDCYKFRTMKPDADTSTHRKYLESLIKGDSHNDSQARMVKLVDEPQIIPFGNLLRESGLDELPQLFNVFLGDMSLIGPRPPIPYEVKEYKIWYRDRFDVLPGITGLWQVSGKNRLTFNEMMRLDITYARNVTLLGDLKIILLTPYAVYSQFKDYLCKKSIMQNPSATHR